RPEQVDCAARLGAQAVEIQTATYSEAKTPPQRAAALEALRDSARWAVEAGLHVHLGHGPDYHHVPALTALPGGEERKIRPSIVSRAVLVGLERAVREMKEAIRSGSPAGT